MNNYSVKRLLGAGLLCISLGQGYSQVLQTGSIGGASPDSKLAQGGTATGLDGIASPNLFTGAMSITVPIHGYSQEGKDFGIALGYNTMGVRVDAYSSPAGTGWSILSGSITRVVRDIPDELNIVTEATIEFDDTTFVNKNRLLKGKYVTFTETPAQQAEPNVYRDGEYDDFVFSCGGQSFTFNLGKDLEVFTHPHRNIKVSPMIDGVPVFGVPGQPVGAWGTAQDNNLLEFLITDESGVKYYFARGDYERRPLYTNEYYESDQMGVCYPTLRWVIKKVVLANGNEINYSYEPHVAINIDNYKQYYAREIWNASGPVSASFLFPNTVTGPYYSTRLSSISYPDNITASFLYDPVNITEQGLPLLREISIGSQGNCLRYKLAQSKTGNRWFLNSIRLASCDGTIEQRYFSFDYNPSPMPDRLSPAQDLLGYYNGVTNNQALGSSGTDINIPVHHNLGGSQSYMNYGALRVSHFITAQAGMLTRVTNAFGGETSLRYRGNTAQNIYAQGGITLPDASTGFIQHGEYCGGLRIDSLIEKEPLHPENAKITVFDYHNSGQQFIPGGYVHYPEYVDSATGLWTKRIFQNMFLTPHQLINSANHGYSWVTTTTYTSTGQLLGKKEVKFTNMYDAGSGNPIRYYTTGKHFYEYPYTDKSYLKDWEIGKPLEVTEYDKNNRIIRQTINEYDFSPVQTAFNFANTKTAKAASGTAINVGPIQQPNAYYPNKKVYTDTYYPYTGQARIRCSRTRNYISDSRYSEDSTLYVYDDHDNIRIVTAHNSLGEKIKTNYVYNYNVGGSNVAGGAAPGSVLYNMTETGLEKVVSIEKWKYFSSSGGAAELLDASINTFSLQGGILLSKASYGIAASMPISQSSYVSGPSSNPYSRVIAAFSGQTPPDFKLLTDTKLNDAKGNPLETELMESGVSKAMIWDTQSGELLAEVSHARYAEVAFSGFESTTQGNFQYNAASVEAATSVPGGPISGNKVLKVFNTESNPLSHNGLPAGKEYTLAFWCYGGIPQVAGAGLGNIPLTNVYAQNGWVYYTAKFTPASSSPLGFTQTGSPGSPFAYYLDDVRLFPTVAGMQTYNYIPLFGLGSSADVNGRVTTYELDKLGRKALVRNQQKNIIIKTKYYNSVGL